MEIESKINNKLKSKIFDTLDLMIANNEIDFSKEGCMDSAVKFLQRIIDNGAIYEVSEFKLYKEWNDRKQAQVFLHAPQQEITLSA